MSGKLIVNTTGQFGLAGKVKIFIDGKEVATMGSSESMSIPIKNKCVMTAKLGVLSKSTLEVEDNVKTVVTCGIDKVGSQIGLKLTVDSVTPNDESYETSGTDEIPAYKIKGVRGRHLKVFDDRCVITTKMSVGSLITGNATDGEKTIYYVDCIGVQFKKAGLTLGYLQLETASGIMNNISNNLFNENTFTFDTSVSNAKMKEVAEYIKKQVHKAKTARNAPVTVAAASGADELKKFKELLDMGVITQEEFDAKKKQILGI